jgi:hypothetical protein
MGTKALFPGRMGWDSDVGASEGDTSWWGRRNAMPLPGEPRGSSRSIPGALYGHGQCQCRRGRHELGGVQGLDRRRAHRSSTGSRRTHTVAQLQFAGIQLAAKHARTFVPNDPRVWRFLGNRLEPAVRASVKGETVGQDVQDVQVYAVSRDRRDMLPRPAISRSGNGCFRKRSDVGLVGAIKGNVIGSAARATVASLGLANCLDFGGFRRRECRGCLLKSSS